MDAKEVTTFAAMATGAVNARPYPLIGAVYDALSNKDYDETETAPDFLEQELSVLWGACVDLEYIPRRLAGELRPVQRALALYAMDESERFEGGDVWHVTVAGLWSLTFSGALFHEGVRAELERWAESLDDGQTEAFYAWQPLPEPAGWARATMEADWQAGLQRIRAAHDQAMQTGQPVVVGDQALGEFEEGTAL